MNAILPHAGPRRIGLAFLGVVILGGANAVAVRVASREVAPLWGATLRFGIAALVLFLAAGLSRTPLPRGRALRTSMLYGAVGFAGAFGCIHWALTSVPPASAQTTLALVPLLTFLSAVVVGLERFRWASLGGAVVAFAGIAMVFREQLGTATPLPPLIAVAAGAAFMAGSNIIVKRHPSCHAIAHHAVAMTTGAAILLGASLLTGETQAIATDTRTWFAVAYVSVAGTAVVFTLFSFVIRHWTASASSYVMLLMPFVTVVLASLVLGQTVSPALAIGGGLALVGVGVSTMTPHRRGIRSSLLLTQPVIQPGCA